MRLATRLLRANALAPRVLREWLRGVGLAIREADDAVRLLIRRWVSPTAGAAG